MTRRPPGSVRRARGRRRRRPRPRLGRVRARGDEPVRRAREGDPALHPGRPDRGGERDHHDDRADPAVRLLDRLVRARTRAGSGPSSRPARVRKRSIQKVTWTGGSVPTGEDSALPVPRDPRPRARRTRSPSARRTRTGRSSTGPGRSPPTRRRRRSRRRARSAVASSTLAIVALVVGGVALVLAVVALVARSGGRALA